MQVLKVVAEGLTTSFRYPHFMLQIHPSFQMPPPATIYGHICSALGEWFDPTGVRFAYHFTHQGEVKDTEHIIMLTPSGGKLPGTGFPKAIQGNINPFERVLLFQPRLTLYINRPDWFEFFRSPRYAVSLGRSQDLFTYTRVSVVELRQTDLAYFEHTLMSYEMGLRMARGVTVLMPRYLDYSRNRRPVFDRYVVIKDRILQSDGPYWVDPETPAHEETHLGLAFHNFMGDDNESTTLA